MVGGGRELENGKNCSCYRASSLAYYGGNKLCRPALLDSNTEMTSAKPWDNTLEPILRGEVVVRGMRTALREWRADQAALDAYRQSRRGGESHQRALNLAMLRWIQHCGWVDGRLARVHIRALLFRAELATPENYDDWVIAAAGSDAWQHGPLSAVQRLSIQCRNLVARTQPKADEAGAKRFERTNRQAPARF